MAAGQLTDGANTQQLQWTALHSCMRAGAGTMHVVFKTPKRDNFVHHNLGCYGVSALPLTAAYMFGKPVSDLNYKFTKEAAHKLILNEYKRFHDANRNAPDAKYLLNTCWGHCQGTGDRLRGILWTLRLAVAYRRILLIDWTHPGPITDYLLPSSINWTTEGFDRTFITDGPMMGHQEVYDAWYKADPVAQAAFNETKIARVLTNEWFYIDMPGTTQVNYTDKVPIGNCYFHFMFKVNPVIVERAKQHLEDIYGPQPTPFVAWHWRHGDADQHEEKPVLVSHLHSALQCAQSLARNGSLEVSPRRPLLLISDFNVMRHFVLHGYTSMLATPNITAKHIDQDDHLAGAEAAHRAAAMALFRDVFVDLYLMSRASCLLTSRSGFSKAALWMADNDLMHCHRDWLTCQEEIVW